MAASRLTSVLHQLLRRATTTAAGEVSDSELLNRFVRHRDDAAFELLLWRHGPMVLGLCQRLLHGEQDAEDAFQATFLVLVRKARSIGKRDALASWLYKVAFRIACRLRSSNAVVAASIALEDVAAPEQPNDLIWRDLRALLDQEVARLPEAYRRPIVLCYLEGKTNDEAARLLGWPRGTVATRLARGRERLRLRLERRGLALSAVAFASVLADNVLADAVSAELVRTTLGGAVAYAAGPIAAKAVLSAKSLTLTEGVLRIMWYNQLKLLATVLLAVVLAGTGVGLAVHQAWAETGQDDPKVEPAEQRPQVAQGEVQGGKRGVSQAELTKLRQEIATLRQELETASREIKDLQAALRQPNQPPEPGPLYRGRPARFWLEQLKDADPTFRKDAVVALGALAQKQKLLAPVLISALKDPDAGVGDAAMTGLIPLGSDVIPALLEFVKDKSARTKQYLAIRTLSSMGPEAKAAVPLLIEIAKDKDSSGRMMALGALGEIGPDAKAALPLFIETLKGDDAKMRHYAAGSLAGLKAEAQPAIPLLVELMGRQMEEFNRKLDLQKKKKAGFGGSSSISRNSSESPFFLLRVMTLIDPTIRDLLPPELGNGETDDFRYLPQAYEALKKKYTPEK